MGTSSRTIVVTGATRGIGRALVEEFVRVGHVVHGCGRSGEAIDALRERHGAPCSFTALDVSDDAAVAAWARALLEVGPAPDLLVNNAAVMNRLAPLWDIAASEFDALMAVNVGGVANVVRAFTPAMSDAGRGVIVNLSSGWGRSTSPEVGPYCTSKWAIEGFTGSLSQELPAGLAAVALSPGIVDTDMLRACLPGTASSCDGPGPWAARNAPRLLALDASDNGASLTFD